LRDLIRYNGLQKADKRMDKSLKKNTYLDFAATSPVEERVFNAMLPYFNGGSDQKMPWKTLAFQLPKR
jgi:selenocysteine lyase/cysteine desulfurase